MGKTSFIQSMIREQANMGIPGALFVANESMNIRYVSRFYMILAQQKVERPFEENMKDIRDEFVKGMPIHIVQKYGMSIDYIRQKSIPLFMEQSVKCLYVEDIHSIQEYRFEKDRTKAARIVRKGLKQLPIIQRGKDVSNYAENLVRKHI